MEIPGDEKSATPFEITPLPLWLEQLACLMRHRSPFPKTPSKNREELRDTKKATQNFQMIICWQPETKK
jgi:hypothetical protein